MWSERQSSPEIVPNESIAVFALPDLVLFPHIEIPLHIFEERCRKMLADALSGNNLIALSRLKEGYETASEPLPSHDIVGIGYIKLSMQNEDGTYNILVEGTCRAKIKTYIQWEPYRLAKVEVLKSTCKDVSRLSKKVRQLHHLLAQKLLLGEHPDRESIRKIESLKDPEKISSVAAYTAQVSSLVKQELLETLELNERFDRLIELTTSEIGALKDQS